MQIPFRDWQLLSACSHGDLRRVQAQLAAGADIGLVLPQTGDSLLHLAAGGGSADVVRFLLSRGVPVNATNGEGLTPLDVATLARRPGVRRLLQGHGAVGSGKLPPASGQFEEDRGPMGAVEWGGLLARAALKAACIPPLVGVIAWCFGAGRDAILYVGLAGLAAFGALLFSTSMHHRVETRLDGQGLRSRFVYGDPGTTNDSLPERAMVALQRFLFGGGETSLPLADIAQVGTAGEAVTVSTKQGRTVRVMTTDPVGLKEALDKAIGPATAIAQ